MKRNNYIRNKSLKTFFMASVLVSIVSQVNALIDGIIVSNVVSPDAISALSLTSPVYSLLFLFAGIISAGASILVPQEVGAQNYLNVKRLFTVCIISGVVVNIPVSLLLLYFTDSIAELLTVEERLLTFVKDYLPVVFIGSILVVVQVLLFMFVKMIGKPQLVMRAVIAQCLGNILLDIVLVKFMNLGIEGAAWATNLACLLATIYLVSRITGKDNMLSIVKPERRWFVPMIKDLMSTGIPSTIGMLSNAIMVVVLNWLVLEAQGINGMFILTINIQMMMICMLVLGGASEAIQGIGGVMLGEKDIDGYRGLIGDILKKTFIAIAVITILLMIRPQLLAQAFGATDEMIEVVTTPLRVLCLMYLPLCLVSLLVGSFMLLGHKTLVSAIMVLMLLFTLLPIWITSVYCSEYLWYSFTIGIWLLFGITMLCSFVMSWKDRTLHSVTLIPVLPNDPSVSVSVNYNRESVQNALDEIHLFLDICELEKSIRYKIDCCIEELTYNLITITENMPRKGTFDLRVVDDGSKIMIVMKDDGKPYNPIMKYDTGNEVSAEDANLGLVMLNGMCPDINYKYMNGINFVYLNFEYKLEIAS